MTCRRKLGHIATARVMVISRAWSYSYNFKVDCRSHLSTTRCNPGK